MKRRAAILIFSLVLPAVADEAPSWLRELATAKLPDYGKKVPAAVLLNEERVAVDESGRITTTTRAAIRILTREGRDQALARESYQTDGGKVKNLEAWMISPTGEVKKLGKSDTADVAVVDDDIYNETRVRVIMGRDRADPGATFGFEGQTEQRSVFTQFDWPFQDELPARLTRFELTLPAGWRAESITFNHPAVAPAISGNTYAWQLRDLAPLEIEEAAPEMTSLVPRLAVSFFPPAGSKSLGRSFSTWTDVSKWLSELNDPQSATSDALAAKAKELISNKSDDFARIQGIGQYVQSLKYVSIQTGIQRGGGFKPHPASEVFAKGYGDCKDKANLMRTMLHSVGVEAWPVAIYSGDRTYVRPEWPSPHQFNHAIVAIRVPDQVRARAVMENTPLGRILFFDPTDEHTPVGWLPEDELGSQALIVAGENGALVHLPAPDPAARRVERRSEVVLAGDGGITVHVHERNTGEEGIANSRLLRTRSLPDYQKQIERWIASSVNAAVISKLEPSEAGPAEFLLDLDFAAPRFAQLMQGRLLVFKPSVLANRGRPNLNQSSRKTPIMLEGKSVSDSVEVRLPEGFIVDELPEPAHVTTPFGSWETSAQVKDGKVIFLRRLQLETTSLPPERHSEVRDFFNEISRSEQAPVVLVRR